MMESYSTWNSRRAHYRLDKRLRETYFSSLIRILKMCQKVGWPVENELQTEQNE